MDKQQGNWGVGPMQDKLIVAFMELARKLNTARERPELVQIFTEVFDQLFPGRLIAIRLLESGSLEFHTAYANGRLRNDRRDSLRLTKGNLLAQAKDCEAVEALLKSGLLELSESYEPVFAEGQGGFGRVLCDHDELYGILNVEYTNETTARADDEQLITPFVFLMCAAVRNAQLFSETTYLKNYLEKLLDRANAPVLVMDRGRKVVVVNQAFERLVGFNRDDLLGKDFMTLLTDGERNRILPAVLRSLRGDDVSNVELRIPHASGRGEAHIAFNTATLLAAPDDVEGVIWVGQDLTKIRDLEQQIIHSEKLATLGQVAAGVAHELNNPLTSISVYGSFLANKLDGQIEEGDLCKLERIVEAAARIQSFTKDLVSYARPAAAEPQLVFIDELFSRVLSFCEHVIADAEAQVEVDIEDSLRPILGISGQLEQVFVNLITNACHALPAEGGQIEITARKRDGDRLQITVADNGCGIDEDYLGRVFEPFFTTKKEGRGTGLGLSIARNILLNHDATINADSTIGNGTKFTVTMYGR